MKTQNYNNHMRLVGGWHGITFLLIIALLVGSIINLCNTTADNLYAASLICLVAVIFGFFFVFARYFALKAQDRAIRAEENLRYFVLTGNLLPKELRLSQIIALRFASDAEFVALAQKAVVEKLSNKAIKKAIKDWRADYSRV